MRYKNAIKVLPEKLIEQLQQYVQGEYIYIPIKDRMETINPTEYEVELQKRDKHIYTKFLEGVDKKELARIYCLSESSIRRIIIKQRKGYSDMKERIHNILKLWNIEETEVTQIYDSAWQVGDQYILKVYEDVNMLNRNIKVLTILTDMDIPVSQLVRNCDDVVYVNDGHYYYILTEKLKGKNIVDLQGMPHVGKKMGKIIARLHKAFKKCENQDEFWNNSLLGEMQGWIKSAFVLSEWKYIPQEKFESTINELEALYKDLPYQLIHRDVHFGNFLFDEGEFSGYIDFDLSQKNIRIFDLCYFLCGLLSEEEIIYITEDEWFKMLEEVFSGYHEVFPLEANEIRVIPYVMEAIELLFVAWFSRENDTKCAKDAVRIYEFIYCNRNRIMEKLQSLSINYI